MNVTATDRAYLAEIMDMVEARWDRFRYLQLRPMKTAELDNKQELVNLLQTAAAGSVRWDCSESVQAVFHVAGLKNPSGTDWAHGNTNMMEQNLTRISPWQAELGTLVVFHNPDHVAIVRRPGTDPVIWSMGSKRLQYLHVSEEQPYHTGPTVYLAISKLG